MRRHELHAREKKFLTIQALVKERRLLAREHLSVCVSWPPAILFRFDFAHKPQSACLIERFYLADSANNTIIRADLSRLLGLKCSTFRSGKERHVISFEQKISRPMVAKERPYLFFSLPLSYPC